MVSLALRYKKVIPRKRLQVILVTSLFFQIERKVKDIMCHDNCELL